MPTRKPIIQVVLSEKYAKKLEYIAKDEERSKSAQCARIIEKFIDDYEQQHGTIKNLNIIDNKGTINM